MPQQEIVVKKPRSRRRIVIAAVLIGLVVLTGLAVGREIVRNNYYVTANDGTVSIMRGISGSMLGIAMQSPYLLGCLNDRGELSQISYGQPLDNLDCRLMQLQDLRPSERAQVAAGLPGGSLDEAIAQLRELSRTSLLPLCPPATTGATSTRTTPAPAPSPRATAGGSPGSETATAATPSSAPATTSASSSPSPSATPSPSASPSASPPPPPTVTALPPPPPKPGTDCRVAA